MGGLQTKYERRKPEWRPRALIVVAKPTRLRILDQRPAEDGDDDDRPVTQAFPVVSAPAVAPNSPLAEDVLAILRRGVDRAEQAANHAQAVASAAIETAAKNDATLSILGERTATIDARTAAVEEKAQVIGERAMAAIAESGKSGMAARQAAAAVTAGALKISVQMVCQLLAYALDRLPMLLALAAAVWLWARVLDDPTVLRLIGLGLFGALVIAPALWLSARRANAGGSNGV